MPNHNHTPYASRFTSCEGMVQLPDEVQAHWSRGHEHLTSDLEAAADEALAAFYDQQRAKRAAQGIEPLRDPFPDSRSSGAEP